MTLRRRTPIKPSRGTVISGHIRNLVLSRDHYSCAGGILGWKSHQAMTYMSLEIDHVRASHGTGMKSETVASNLVALCGPCHRWRTENGKVARPLLLSYLATFEEGARS